MSLLENGQHLQWMPTYFARYVCRYFHRYIICLYDTTALHCRVAKHFRWHVSPKSQALLCPIAPTNIRVLRGWLFITFRYDMHCEDNKTFCEVDAKEGNTVDFMKTLPDTINVSNLCLRIQRSIMLSWPTSFALIFSLPYLVPIQTAIPRINFAFYHLVREKYFKNMRVNFQELLIPLHYFIGTPFVTFSGTLTNIHVNQFELSSAGHSAITLIKKDVAVMPLSIFNVDIINLVNSSPTIQIQLIVQYTPALIQRWWLLTLTTLFHLLIWRYPSRPIMYVNSGNFVGWWKKTIGYYYQSKKLS